MEFKYTYNGIERTTEISNKEELSNLSNKQIADLSRTFIEAISLGTNRNVVKGFETCTTLKEIDSVLSKNKEPEYEILLNEKIKMMTQDQFTIVDILRAILNKESVCFHKREMLSPNFSTMVYSYKPAYSYVVDEGKIKIIFPLITPAKPIYIEFKSDLEDYLSILNNCNFTEYDINDYAKVAIGNTTQDLLNFIQYTGKYRRLYSKLISANCKKIIEVCGLALNGDFDCPGLLSDLNSLNVENLKLINNSKIDYQHLYKVFTILKKDVRDLNNVNWNLFQNETRNTKNYNWDLESTATYAIVNIMQQFDNYKLSEREIILSNIFMSSNSQYFDYLKMRGELSERIDLDEFPATISPDDIKVYHDRISTLYDRFQNELKDEKYIKRRSACERYNYMSQDKTLLIRAPKEVGEIASEGSKLHHCVASYIDRVCDGATTILFIRKAKCPEKPYYTVEVLNDGTVNQVYGMNDTIAHKDVNEFVQEWINYMKKENRINLRAQYNGMKNND